MFHAEPFSHSQEYDMTDIEIQARKLRNFVSRGGNPDKWWASKEFSFIDACKIEEEYFRLEQEVEK